MRAPARHAIARGWDESLPRIDTQQCVGLADIMPTVLDITGTPYPLGLMGAAFFPLSRNRMRLSDAYQVTVYDQNFGISDGRYNYCWFGDSDEELLFDIENDPREERDLSAGLPNSANAYASAFMIILHLTTIVIASTENFAPKPLNGLLSTPVLKIKQCTADAAKSGLSMTARCVGVCLIPIAHAAGGRYIFQLPRAH